MKMLPLVLSVLVSSALPVVAGDYVLHSFKKIQLTDKFWSEGAHFADFNRDGKMEIVSGPYWYEGPDFQKRHEYRPATATFKRKKSDGTEETVEGYEGGLGTNNAYSDAFFTFTADFNRDGWPDILVIGLPGENAFWFENPQGREGHWPKHLAFDVVDNESPTFTDITGDGKPELICNSKGFFGYAEPDWNEPTKMWEFHPITPNNNYGKYQHGLGVGDVNGDGRMDLIEKDGWWEQPASLAGDPVWTKHPFNFCPEDKGVPIGGAQMYAYDVNGDGRNDVITALACHGYGLAWYENVVENGQITFRPHIFMNKQPSDSKYGVKFTQPHAIDLIDMDGDGLKDIVTGKRFWAHGPQGDPEPNAPAVLYWFKLVRGPNQSVDFIPYLIDDNSGVGTQVVAGRIGSGKYPDVVVGNKKGTFFFKHEARTVSKEEWEKAQPKLVGGSSVSQAK
jgi:hypothetical protein